jgi:hypothetical protein
LASAATECVQIGGPAGVVGDRTSRFDVGEQVGTPVLNGLEGADRPAELIPRLGIPDGHVKDVLRPAGLLGRERRRGLVEGPAQHGQPGAVLPDQPGLRGAEC